MIQLPKLPVIEVLDQLDRVLTDQHEAILTAPPGAGKTTLVPLACLASSWLLGQKIILLQPRRIAVRAAAQRMAELCNGAVGERIGYRVRMETRVSAQTQIEIMTEGVYLRLLNSDPALEGVGLVIFDECHERHLDTDLALALTLNARKLFSDLRPQPLKLLLMSATLEATALQRLLQSDSGHDVPLIESFGRSFPVQQVYLGNAAHHWDQTDALFKAVSRALNETTGHILVFLPGVAEINRLQQRFHDERMDSQIEVSVLHGNLALAQQHAVLQPPAQGIRRITLATSIAQTSLTIEGVSVVVDSGYIRVPRFDPRTGLSRLESQRISKATAAQRAGRAGRLGPGFCYRLWSEAEQFNLTEHDTPEIVNADLCQLTMQLIAWGTPDASDLAWLDPPKASSMASAYDLLVQLGAVTQHQLTLLGEQMLALPVHPRLAAMVMFADDKRSVELAGLLSALISAKDPLADGNSSDIADRVDYVKNNHSRVAKQLRREAQQIISARPKWRSPPKNLDHLQDSQCLAVLLAIAYPDRIAKRTQGCDFKLANGRGVSLQPHDPLARCDWLVVTSLGGRQGLSRDNVFLAAAFDPNILTHELPGKVVSKEVTYWDSKQDRLLSERQTWLGELCFRSEPSEVSRVFREQALLDYVRITGLSLFNWDAGARQLCARVRLAAELEPGSGWPDFTDSGLLAALEKWLLPAAGQIRRGEDFKQVQLPAQLLALLDWSQQQRLAEQFPKCMLVPSGLEVEIDYLSYPPILAVKLQAMFGLKSTPTIAGGRVPLVVHLLSPAGRPLQVTQDLAGFWAGSYQQVRREMKGRYPKHPWPEYPYSMPATHRAKPRPQKG